MTAERIMQVAHAKTEVIPPEMLSWLKGQPCDGSKFHSPKPLLVKPVHLCDAVGLLVVQPTMPACDDVIYLCSTCRDNLTVFLSILVAYDGVMPNLVRRDFGNTIRDLGDRAWSHHLKRSVEVPV